MNLTNQYGGYSMLKVQILVNDIPNFTHHCCVIIT